MATNYVRFRFRSSVDWGLVGEEGRIAPLRVGDLSTRAFIDALRRKKKPAPRFTTTLREVALLSPISAPAQIICQGANYRQHMIESGLNPDQKRYNMFFTKSDASLSPPIGNVIRPSHVRLLDYELELGLVFGRSIDHPIEVNAQNLSKFVAAIFMANDVSARDIQLPQMQWYKGKSYRTFLPAGPVLAVLSPTDFAKLDLLDLVLSVNGEVRQKDQASNLVFKPAETITELSQFCNVSPGDVLLTGTPSGCALRVPGQWQQKVASLLSEPKKWELFLRGQLKRREYLNPGDQVESSIRTTDGSIDLGVQRWKVVQDHE